MDERDADGNGKIDSWAVDWDGDGEVDEWWYDTNEDGTVDSVAFTSADDTRSPRGQVGKTRATPVPTAGGGGFTGIDWEGDGVYDEYWFDDDRDGIIEDTRVKVTESKVLDNTKSTRFRGVFVGVNNGLKHAEKDAEEVSGALEGYPNSWSEADTTELIGAAANPAAIQNAINAAKADSKPGDEFIFFFSGHGGGYDAEDGYDGGIIDADGDESAIPIREKDFKVDGSDLATAAPGMANGYVWDTNNDGKADFGVTKDENGKVTARVWNPGPPAGWGEVRGTDVDGDGDVDGADGGVDINGDGDKNDTVYVDDAILVAGGANVTDDQLTTWLSGFPESVTIVVMLDSCFSGSFIPDLQRVKDKNGKPLRPGHMEVVASAPADDTCFERPIDNGVLTQSILNALAQVDEGTGVGEHTTSVADHNGNSDDITTTRELFAFAGPQATAFFIGDEDGDGILDEDEETHGYVAQSFEITGGPELLPSLLVHGQTDPDGDGPGNVDVQPPPESFFDVYFAPEYGGLGTPRFIQTLGGDTELSITGMLPGIAIRSNGPFMPGDVTSPGPLLQYQVLQVPDAAAPEPPVGASYASEAFDLSLHAVEVTPALDAVDQSGASLELTELPAGWNPDTTVTIRLGEWAPPGASGAAPFRYNESSEEWEPVLPFEYEFDLEDPTRQWVNFRVDHHSTFAVFYIGPWEMDLEAPAPPTDLQGSRQGMDARLMWFNPTDPDWASTLVYGSSAGFAASPMGGAGQYTVHSGTGFTALDEDLDVDTYYYTAFARDFFGNWSAPATCTVDMSTTITEAQGATRYETAIAASQEAYPNGLTRADPEGHRSIVVATGANWPDALGGAALAGAVRGPILLTKPTELPSSVADEIERLGADRVFVLGGTAAVGAAVETSIDNVPGVASVERLQGATRCETAEAIAERTVELLGDSYDGTVFVATGLKFPDALAASPLASARRWPLYLSGAAGLSDSTKSSIGDVGATDGLVLGGVLAVPQSVEDYLDAELDSVERLSGSDRYATAVDIADFGINGAGMDWSGTGIATGENFPDALAGGVLVGRRNAVLLLTHTNALDDITSDALTANRDAVSEVVFLGGTAAVSQGVRDAVSAILR